MNITDAIDISLAIGLLCIGAALGGLIAIGWKSNGKPLADQLAEIRQSETVEDLARRTQA